MHPGLQIVRCLSAGSFVRVHQLSRSATLAQDARYGRDGLLPQRNSEGHWKESARDSGGVESGEHRIEADHVGNDTQLGGSTGESAASQGRVMLYDY